jgi:hypothetical protein
MKKSRKPFKKPSLGAWLIAGLATCLLLMLKTSNDPLVSWLQGTKVGTIFSKLPTGNEVAFNLSAATASAILMYYVLVKIPEQQKKKRVKAHLLRTYDRFKEQCIATFVGLADGHYSGETVQSLMSSEKFKEYFKERVGPDMNRWDAAANRMNDYSLRQLTVEMEILYNEFQHVMTVTDIQDDELHSFFKHLSEQLYKWRLWQEDYDGVKSAMGFFWQGNPPAFSGLQKWS